MTTTHDVFGYNIQINAKKSLVLNTD